MTVNKKSKPDSLWHFCSFETFVKIFQTGNIRLSDIVKSNDKTELISNPEEIKKFINKFDDYVSKKDIKDTVNYFTHLLQLPKYKSFKNGCVLWAFCTGFPSDSLWHWKEYSDNFSGVAIEFVYDKLQKQVKKLNDINDLISFDLIPVKYIDEINEDEILDINNKIKEVESKGVGQSFKNSYARLFCRYKDQSFSMENEYRLIALNEVKERIKYKIQAQEFEAVGNNVIDNLGYELLSELKKDVSTSAKFGFHIRNNMIISHIDCKIDLAEIVSSVVFCDNHTKEEIEEIIKLTINKTINVNPYKTSYIPT